MPIAPPSSLKYLFNRWQIGIFAIQQGNKVSGELLVSWPKMTDNDWNQ